eukprot:gene28947-35905_t
MGGAKSPLTLMVSDPARPRVFIESFQHEVFALDVDMQHTTVGEIKRAIQGRLDCAPAYQHLYLAKTYLGDNDDLLSVYTQSSECTIVLCVIPENSIQLFVQLLTGKTKTIKTSLWQTVDEVKFYLYAHQGIPVEQQRLIFEGRQLEDGGTLSEYRMSDCVTVHLVLRLKGC